MAGEAETVWITLSVEDPSDPVRLVAIDAARDLVGPLLPELPANHPLMDFLDLGMALHAGPGDPVPVDGRFRVLVRQDQVRRVTAGTHSRDDQPPLVQTIPVDRLRILLQG